LLLHSTVFGSDDLTRVLHSSARIGTCYVACRLGKGSLNNSTAIAIIRPPLRLREKCSVSIEQEAVGPNIRSGHRSGEQKGVKEIESIVIKSKWELNQRTGGACSLGLQSVDTFLPNYTASRPRNQLHVCS
jgi:hypothetical protein